MDLVEQLTLSSEQKTMSDEMKTCEQCQHAEHPGTKCSECDCVSEAPAVEATQ